VQDELLSMEGKLQKEKWILDQKDLVAAFNGWVFLPKLVRKNDRRLCRMNVSQWIPKTN